MQSWLLHPETDLNDLKTVQEDTTPRHAENISCGKTYRFKVVQALGEEMVEEVYVKGVSVLQEK